MTREPVDVKGRRYLLEGRLLVTHIDAGSVRATCRGDGAVHKLGHDDGVWFCSCPARRRCAHLAALKLVTAAGAQ